MIRFEVSRDRGLLNQYYALREACFRKELGIPDYDGSEEEKDRKGHILIAHKEGKCVGGIRISSQLPADEHLQDLDVDTRTSCTWERFVFHPDERSVQFSREFLGNLIDICHKLDYRHAVVVSSLRNARFYRLFHTALGIPFEIVRAAPEFAQGAFADLEHYVSALETQAVLPRSPAELTLCFEIVLRLSTRLPSRARLLRYSKKNTGSSRLGGASSSYLTRGSL